MTATATKTYDVFRSENRGEGSCDWVGTIEADTERDALERAKLTYECSRVCSLYVSEADHDDA